MPHVPDEDMDAGGRDRLPASGPFERDVLALLPALRRYAVSLSRSSADGEDLLQDCVERVLRRRGQWRGGNLKSWAFAIMTNLNRDRHRGRGQAPTEPIEPHAETLPSHAATDAEERMRLARALGRLSTDHRAILVLVAVEGYSYREIADILGVPPGTVMSRLSRARDALTEAMAHDNIIALRRPR